MNVKKSITAFMLLFSMVISVHGQSLTTIKLSVAENNDDPTELLTPVHRTPIRVPNAALGGHTLYIESCEGCQLQLVKDNDVVYSTVITSGVVELPDTFTGNYELRIIRGGICFWAEIEL